MEAQKEAEGQEESVDGSSNEMRAVEDRGVATRRLLGSFLRVNRSADSTA